MAKFTNPAALRKHLEAALKETLKETIIETQNELGATAPRFTGTMRSSWFAGAGSPNRSAPELGTDSPRTDARGLDVNLDQPYYLSSNLDYSERVCLTSDWPAKSAPDDWFRVIRDFGVISIGEAAARKAKAKYDL